MDEKTETGTMADLDEKDRASLAQSQASRRASTESPVQYADIEAQGVSCHISVSLA